MIKEYDRASAVAYAKKWALGHNPKYFHFSGLGGDCTNFVSQCLHAGGGVFNWNKFYGWFYINSNNRSPSWASVKYLQRFLLRSSGVGPFARIEKLENLQIGDIIQLKKEGEEFHHTLIVSKILNGRIFVCAHSTDALDAPLWAYDFDEALGLHIEGIRV